MKTVIMVDDDASILEIFKIVFERAGYTITMFNNPKIIFENRFDEPDIFIIDKQLNGVDGSEVCRFLKQRHLNKKTPVIIFSASTHIENYAKNAGADYFLEKPFNTRDLLNKVERLIG